jgi:1,2-dihydroxy-3-keto-5-methylthiopentene dioxygenase
LIVDQLLFFPSLTQKKLKTMATRLGYTAAASYMHWIVAFPLIGSVASVLQAQSAPKEQKGELMWRHKSLGLLTGMLVAPRVAYRLLSRDSYRLLPLVGNTPTENTLGKITHYLLYGFMIVMPASGIAMGYYGGKVISFSLLHFERIDKPIVLNT